MAEDIDLSLLMPMDCENDTKQDDLLTQIFDGRYVLLPEQQTKLQNLIDAQSQGPSHNDVVTISEEDLLAIIGDSGNVTDLDDMLNVNCTSPLNIQQESTDVIGDFLSDPTAQPVPITDFPDLLTTPNVNSSVSDTKVSKQSDVYVPNKTKQTTKLKQLNPTTQFTTPEISPALPKVSAQSTKTEPKLEVPLTITLPPTLPAGKYLMKHSMSDPNMVELCFPDNPDMKPILIPIGSKAPVPMHLPRPPSNQISGPRIRGGNTLSVNLNRPATSLGQNQIWKAPVPNVNIPLGNSNVQQKGTAVRPINTTSSTMTRVPVGVPSAKLAPAHNQPLIKNISIPMTSKTSSQIIFGTSQSSPVVAVPLCPTLTNTSGWSNYPIPLSKIQPAAGVTITNPSPSDGLQLGAPVQLSTGSKEPIRTPIKLGNITYLPVGFPVSSESLQQGSNVSLPMLNVSNVYGGIAMTGINTAIQIDGAPKIPVSLTSSGKRKTKLIKQVQVVDTADGLRTKEIISISPVAPNVRPLVQNQKMPLQVIAVRKDQADRISNPQLLDSQTIPVSGSMMDKGVIQHNNVELVGNKTLTLSSIAPKLSEVCTVQPATEPNTLAPISGLLNFALSKTPIPTPITKLEVVSKYIKPPAKRRKIFGRSTATHISLTQPIQPHRTILATPVCFPLSGIEGQCYGPKYIVDDGLIDIQTVEISDEQPVSLTALRIREQSHKMVSVTIRDHCIAFKHEAGAMADLQMKQSMLKSASEQSKMVLNDVTSGENDIEASDHISSKNKNSVTINEDGNSEEFIGDKSNNTVNNLQEELPDEVLKMLEWDIESDRLSVFYNKYYKEQKDHENDHAAKLHSLFKESTSWEQTLSRLFQGVPQFVDDPLTGDSNAPMYFCCYLCPFASFNEAKVCVHWTLVHLKQCPYVCAYCSARFSSSGKAHRHLSIAHPKNKILIKMTSSELFANPIQFEFIQGNEDLNTLCPMIEIGPKANLKGAQRQFVCKECAFTTMEEGTMMYHVRITHFSLCSYTCGHCDQKFRQASLVESHMKLMHPTLEKLIREDTELTLLHERLKLGDFYAVIPQNRPVIFEPDNDYWKHEENKLDRQKKRFSCTMCTFVTKKLDVIWKHVREHHGFPVGVYCRQCSHYHKLSTIERDKEFFVCYCCFSLCSLRLDKMLPCVRLRQVFMCLKCKEQLEDLNLMKKHIKNEHIDTYPYSCITCRAKFVMKQAALNHAMETHGTESVIKKHSLLFAHIMKRVSKLYIKYMYVESEQDGELAKLWEKHGLKIVQEVEHGVPAKQKLKLDLPDDLEEMNTLDDEGGVSIVTNVDTSAVSDANKDEHVSEFAGMHHYRCRLCMYVCLDRSCMARHVKYMHLRIHPHCCPFCGYSNVEKTKVKIHIANLHNKSQKKVRTNTTLVTALGEESKKHFVRVFPNGREVSQVDTGLNRVVKKGSNRRSKHNGTENVMDDPHIKLEPLDDIELEGEMSEDEHIRQIDEDLKAMEWQMKEEADDLEIETDDCYQQDSILYNVLTEPRIPLKRRASQTLEPSVKKRRKPNHIYPLRTEIMSDVKLNILPIIVLHDVLEGLLAGC